MILVLGLLMDAALGEPRWLWTRLPHPAVVMGNTIGWADRRFNTGTGRRKKGMILIAALSGAALLIGFGLQMLPGSVVDIILLAILIAQRSLCDHLRDVALGLRDNVKAGRRAVARIVGRDTKDMDDAQIARAAIESGSENLSDGVIAPIFWFALLGLPGLLLYKVVNTADSMIGYKTPRHADFGFAAARLDDLLNILPARLTAVMILVVTGRADLWASVKAEAPRHRSPNAGWPEAAAAHALGIALSGPRIYNGIPTKDPFVNATGRKDLTASDIDAAIRLLWRVWGLALFAALLIALFQAL